MATSAAAGAEASAGGDAVAAPCSGVGSAVTTSRRQPLFLNPEDALGLEYFCIPPHYVDYLESVLIPHGLVLDRVQRLATDIREDYGDSVPHLLCVLKVR